MRRVSSTDQGTYILDDLHSTPRNATLVREVLAEAKKLVDMGYNARFTCDNKIHQKAVEDRLKNSEDAYSSKIFSGSEYDLACQVIEEAKKIVRMGHNAKIGCASVETDTSDREKRREYYRWKRMNRS